MQGSDRIPQLDGLRGIAILAVLGIHAHLLPGGRAGVDIFFALSGYLITGILTKEYARTGTIDILNFYRRRAVRLLPALGVLLFVITVWSQFQTLFSVSNLRAIFAALFYFANWQIVWELPTDQHLGPLTHTWSLSIEEQFYALWPLVVFMGMRFGIGRKGLFALASSGAFAILLLRLWLHWHGASADRIYFGTDTHGDGLLIGCALALLPERVDAFLRRVGPLLCPIAGWLLLLLLLGRHTTTTSSWLGLAAAAGCAVVLIWSIPHSRHLRSALSYPGLVWLGLRSYSLYLWHFPIIWGGPFDFLSLSHPATLFLEVGVSLLLAEASYRLVEQPALRFNRVSIRPKHSVQLLNADNPARAQ